LGAGRPRGEGSAHGRTGRCVLRRAEARAVSHAAAGTARGRGASGALGSGDRHCWRRHAIEQEHREAAAAGSLLPEVQGGGPGVAFEVQIPRFPSVEPGRMTDENRTYTEEFQVRMDEVGTSRECTTETMIKQLQGTAVNHALAMWGRNEHGIATDPSMAEANLVFALAKLQVQVTGAYPSWGDVVRIVTWFDTESRITGRRDWTIYNVTKGESIGGATSLWVVVNYKTRKLSRLPQGLKQRFDFFSLGDARALSDGNRLKCKLGNFFDEGVCSVSPVSTPLRSAGRSDEDLNGHVNNTKFAEWVMDGVPDDIYRSMRCCDIEIEYRAEGRRGDRVFSRTCDAPLPSQDEGGHPAEGVLCLNHIVQRCDDELQDAATCTDLVRARSVWRNLLPGEKAA